MPRTFTLSAHYPAGVGEVYAAFADRDYWLARLVDSGADTATLDTLDVGDDGAVAATTSQRIERSKLPALAARFLSGDLTVTRGEHWQPVRDGQARAQITGAIVGAPAKVRGEAVLAPDGTGSTVRFTATVKVDLPLVGGRVEEFIGGQLRELIDAEQRFTAGWLQRP